VIAGVGVLAAAVWVLLAVPLLVAGFVWLRGWRRRNWLRAARWAGAWIAGLALVVVVVAVGGYGPTFPTRAGESCRSSPRGWHSEP
jgi:peptidoglycan/LPS O-acetylase OafA/YrhL